MAELIDWLNLAIAADTNSAVRSVAAGQAVLVQAELHRRADNSLVNEIVDLYAKARDLRQRGQLLGAFTLTLTAREKYFLGLPGLKDAQLKMRLIDVDEKLNGELTLLMDSEQLACIVMELGTFMKETIERTPNRIQAISRNLEAARKLSLAAGRHRALDVVLAEIMQAWKSHAVLARYFDPALAGPLGSLEQRWRSAVAAMGKIFTPGMDAWLKQLKELHVRWDAEEKKTVADIKRSEILIPMVVVAFLLIVWLIMAYARSKAGP